MNEVNLKKELLREADSKIKGVTKIASSINVSKADVKELLLKEAGERIARILKKRAQRAEKSLDVRNSTANTEWFIPDKSNRIREIEAGLTATFRPYFDKLVTPGAWTDVQDYVIDSSKEPTLQDKAQLEQEPPSIMRMEFGFKKKVIPIEPDFQRVAVKSLDMFDAALERGGVDPLIKQFVKMLEGSHTQLKPYHHRDTAERIQSPELARFVKSEVQRYQEDPLIGSTGNPLPYAQNFYAPHMARIEQNRPEYYPKASYQEKKPRRFRMEDAFHVYIPTYLLRAIAQKIQEGYRLDPQRLEQQAEEAARRMHKFHTLFQYSRNRKKRLKFEFYRKYFKDIAENIVSEYNKAMEPFEGEYSLGVNEVGYQIQDNKQISYARWGDQMRGLRIENLKIPSYCPHCSTSSRNRFKLTDRKATECPRCHERIIADEESKHTYASDLTVHQLQWLLYSLTNKSAEPQRSIRVNTNHGVRSKKIKTLTRDDSFVIPRFSLTRDPNGFDSDPAAPELFSPLTSPLVKIGDRQQEQIYYDTEKGNLGLSHVLYYGRQIEDILRKFGPWCDKALQLLTAGDPDVFADILRVATELDPTDPQHETVPFEAWAVVLSGDRGNRTGAETLLEMLQGKIPVIVQRKVARQKGAPLSYEEYVGLLRQLKGGRKNTQRRVAVDQPEPAPITPEGFQLLQQYGYQTAKMMDFIFALMTRSCEEKLVKKLDRDELQKRTKRIEELRGRYQILEPDPNAMDIQEEYFHGRNYACSTGLAEWGKILFGVMYAFRPPTLGDPNNAAWQKKFKDYWRSRHLRKPELGGGLPFPTTTENRLPADRQQAEPLPEEFQPPFSPDQTWVILEKMTFWSGFSASKSKWCKTVYQGQDYGAALSALLARYPGIANDLGVIFEPVSVMLRDIRLAADSALTGFGKFLKTHNLPTEMMVEDEHGRVRYLDPLGVAGAKAISAAEQETNRQRLAEQGMTLVNDGTQSVPDGEQDENVEDVEDVQIAGHEERDDTGPSDVDESELEPQQTAAPQMPQTAPIAPPTLPGTPPAPAPAGQRPTPPLPVPPTPGDPNQPDLGETGTEPRRRPMPKPFPMEEPSYINKRKVNRSLIRNGPDPNTSKLRHSSLMDDLIKLADKLDDSGQSEVANKVDRLLSILSEE